LGNQSVIYKNSLFFDILSVGLTGALMGILFWHIPAKIQYNLELKADLYSAKLNGKNTLINALKKLDELSNGDVSKGGITHPGLEIRINNINRKDLKNFTTGFLLLDIFFNNLLIGLL
jgi:Zn-dependent protease with chaperone function